jgi:hypothetical protein
MLPTVGAGPDSGGQARWVRRNRLRGMAIAPPQPDGTTRWRCRQCGNLTRFDVTRTSRVVEFLHFDLAGAVTVEETQVLTETLEKVRCRWCDAVDSVDLVPRKDAPE